MGAVPWPREPVALFGIWFGAWPMDLDVVVDLNLNLSLSSDWNERRFKRKKLNSKFSWVAFLEIGPGHAHGGETANWNCQAVGPRDSASISFGMRAVLPLWPGRIISEGHSTTIIMLSSRDRQADWVDVDACCSETFLGLSRTALAGSYRVPSAQSPFHYRMKAKPFTKRVWHGDGVSAICP